MAAKKKARKSTRSKKTGTVSTTVNKNIRGTASEFFVAAELCRRGYPAVVTLGNCPNTDILVSDVEATKFVHIQVKTYKPGGQTCSVGVKAEKAYGENFFWVLVGLPGAHSDDPPTFHVIPASVMSLNIKTAHATWLATPGKKGQAHKDSSVRAVWMRNAGKTGRWDVTGYEGAWALIADRLR